MPNTTFAYGRDFVVDNAEGPISSGTGTRRKVEIGVIVCENIAHSVVSQAESVPGADDFACSSVVCNTGGPPNRQKAITSSNVS